MSEPSWFWKSPYGKAVCDNCGASWGCHLAAWGMPADESNCHRCKNGKVKWHESADVQGP